MKISIRLYVLQMVHHMLSLQLMIIFIHQIINQQWFNLKKKQTEKLFIYFYSFLNYSFNFFFKKQKQLIHRHKLSFKVMFFFSFSLVYSSSFSLFSVVVYVCSSEVYIYSGNKSTVYLLYFCWFYVVILILKYA